MPDAQSLHCPNCGAAADPHAGRCPYCHARLATISCPHCFALMFEGSAFCPKCGARAARGETQSSASRCPSCRNSMTSVAVGEVTLLDCPACDGVWVGAAEFERICADRETQAAVLSRPAPAVSQSPGAIHYRPCIVCGKMMNRMNFGRVSGTVIDVCRGHGVFLDAGELHAIAGFIADGGLDRARQREKDDLDEERRRLTALKAQIESAAPLPDWDRSAAFSDGLRNLRRLLKEE